MPSALSLVRPEAGQESFCCFPALQVVGKEAGLVLRALQKACAVKIRVQPALILGSRGAGPRVHSGCEGELGIALESLQGQRDTHLPPHSH